MDRPCIVVDRDIPWGIEAFEGLGTVVPCGAADLLGDAPVLADADVLACRSVTRVDLRLLRAAPRLRAIATPVIGRDHVTCDAVREAAKERGHSIEVFSAPGSTAAGVADWVVAAILATLPDLGPDRGATVGIWGFGNCGRAVAARLSRLGLRWIAHDPPKEAQTAGTFASAPREALWSCDVVTLHVPLTGPSDSPWPTRGMVDAKAFLAMGLGDVRLLVNTARGDVVDATALAGHLDGGTGPLVAMDVFPGEPAPSTSLVARPRIATAHVAGSVVEGRRKAVARVREDVRRLLHLPSSPFPAEPPGGFALPVPLVVPARPDLSAIRDGIAAAVPLDAWTRFLRETYLAAPPNDRVAAFETARKAGLRREIHWRNLSLPH